MSRSSFAILLVALSACAMPLQQRRPVPVICATVPAPESPAPSEATPAGEPAATPVAPAPRPAPHADTPTAVAPAPRPAPHADTATDSAGRITPTEIARGAHAVFGDTAEAVEPLEGPAGTAEPTWDIDVHSYETTALVERYVSMFTGPARDRIVARLEVGTRYEPMIRAQLRAGGVPEDMYYLALVESGFNPNAYSRAAAVGMWQFMTSTARGMGLRVDWWVDERRDPVRSTRAAARFISALRDQFGSLYLAAAAYNGGPGRIARGLSRYADDLDGTSGDDLFFALAEKDYLRNETRQYVPQLIAAALIAKDPARYGLTIRRQPAFEYDSARVGGSTPLAAVAKASNTTVDAIRELNPQLLRGMTPPRDSSLVRVPRGAGATLRDSLRALPAADLVAFHRVTTRKGDRLADLARRGGVSVDAVEALNPRIRRVRGTSRLVPGQEMLVPTAAVARAMTSVPDPAIERYGRTTRGVRMHVVRRGETLSHIARRYGVTVAGLMRANRMRRSVIVPGQEIAIPRH